MVHARLFRRLELLTLDAQVLVASPDDGEVWVPTGTAPARDGGMARARELLDESAHLLEQARQKTVLGGPVRRSASSR